jgi:hypothetical protein
VKQLSGLKLWVSPLTNIIYAGYLHKNGKDITQKIDITKEAIASVMKHMDHDIAGGDTGVVLVTNAGELTWKKAKK